MAIKVSVDANGNAYVPAKEDKGKGKSTITWELMTKDYRFTGLTFLDPQPPPGIFSNLVVKDNKITIDDDNPGTRLAEYPYRVEVESTVSGNKRTQAGNETMMGGAPIADAGAPVIRNVPN